MSDYIKQGIKVCLRLNPGDDTAIFRIRAADDVLRLLADAHESEFTMNTLATATEHSRSTVWRAVNLLDELGVVTMRETPQRKYVSISHSALQKDDPILGIEQPEYRAPLRAFVERIEGALGDADDVSQLVGVLVFGSVARGEADRKSDIDVFVLVEGDRTVARRVVSTVASELGEEPFDGDRYTFEPFVETKASACRADEKLKEMFREGITVHGGDAMQRVRTAVLSGE
ncbi:nucleotidyltransferase domain-containing protein [Salinigranum marinum]|uniref:nucleotidyltransferase domain-containing protein n=1 Tax=Salinigranum marinum TaxID=1515595 RepID=UPI002989EB27|nr:nucleotidyltransferase domain-containing protein [Salinigranum marinum]